MKNKIVLIYSAVLALSPSVVLADLDPTTLIQDKINVYQEEINKVTKEYIGQEVNLQQMINSRDKLGELKKLGKNFVIDQAMNFGSQIKIRSVTKKGIGKAIKGSVATPQLSRLVGRKMTKKISESNDVAKARQYKEEMNDLVIENVATMFAKALVLRRAIMNETKSLEEEEKTELTDLTQIEDAYKVVANRANGRWKTILDAQANFFGQQATISMIGISVDKKTEEEEAKASGDDLSLDNDATSGALNGDNNMSVSDLYKKGKDTVNNVKSGNYGAALGNLGDTTSGLGAGDVGKYVSASGNLYNKGSTSVEQIKQGNYGAAAGTALGGVTENFGDKMGDKATDILGKTQKGLNASDNVANSVKSGNYGDALNAIGSTTGDMGAGKVGDYIGRAGNVYNAGEKTADQLKSGNYGAAAGTALGGVTENFGDKMGDKATDILGKTQKGLNASDNVANSVKSGNYGDALNAIGSTTGDMGAGKIGDYIGRAGNAYNAGEKTADQFKSGNYGAAAGEALGGFSDTVGDKIDGKAGDIIKGTASGLGSADAAVDALKNKQWKNAWQNIEGGYHNYENASGRNGEKEEDAKPRETPTQETSTPANNGMDYSQWNYGNSQNQNDNKTDKDNEWHAPLAPKDNDSNSKSNSGSKPSWADYGSFAGGSSGYGGNTSNNSNNNWVSPLLPSQQTGSNN